MTKAADVNTIEKGTGIAWPEWLKFLSDINAKDLPHKEIAEQVHQKLEDSLENPSWWAQSVTVAYEQHIGRRKPGQKNDGTFETSVIKTLAASMDDVFQKWLDDYGKQAEFNHIPIAKPATTTSTDKRHHWGVNLHDGSRINVDTDSYTPGKTRITITHTRLSSQATSDHWRQYWQNLLQNHFSN
jgi:hypothetical protein